MLQNKVLHGVGEAIILDFVTGREILRLTRLESTSWSQTVDEQDVSGGDDLDVFDNFETGRNQTMAFQNNEFDMRMLEAATGKKPVKTLSAPIIRLSEGVIISSVGPYTADLKKATAQAASVRIRNNETREDLSPQPTFASSNLALNTGATTFPPSTTVKVRITCVVNGVESIASAEGTISTGAASRGIDVTIPAAIMSVDASLVAYDVDADGFNVYLSESTGPWKKNNTALLAKGALYVLLNTYPTPIVATVGAGLTSPPTLAYNAAYPVAGWAVPAPSPFSYNVGLTQYESDGAGVIGMGIFAYAYDVITDTTDICFHVYNTGALVGTKVNAGPGTTVVTPDDTDDYSALLVYKASTGKRGTLYVADGDVVTFLAAHTELALVRQFTGIYSAPAVAPDDFTYNAGVLAATVNEAGYVASPLFFAVGATIYDDMGMGIDGSMLYVGNDFGGILHVAGGLTTGLVVSGIDVSEDIDVSLVTNDPPTEFTTVLHSANIDIATIIPPGTLIVATFESVFTKPAALNGPFTFNASALIEWPTGDILNLVPTLAGQYSVSGNTVTFSAPDAGVGVLVDYIWTTSATEYQAEVVDVLKDCLRRYVKIALTQKTEEGLQAIVHKAKFTGDFTLDRSRADASTHSMEFKIFDAGRADGKIVSFTKFATGEEPVC